MAFASSKGFMREMIDQAMEETMNQETTREAVPSEYHFPILVIGYGNSLRCDDGVGCFIARKLRSMVNPSKVEVIECRQLMPEMVEQIGGAKLVIFVDASSNGTPGDVCHRQLDVPDANSSTAAFSHAGTAAVLLGLAAKLYATAPEVHLFTVSGSSFDYGEHFSTEVETALPSVVAKIEELIASYTRGED